VGDKMTPPLPSEELVLWFTYIKETILFLGLIGAAFLAYTKFVIERGIFPPAQFCIRCKSLGLQKDKVVLEILLCIKNLGSSVLVVSNLSLELRYIKTSEDPEFLKIRDPKECHLLGRLCFPHCLKEEVCKISIQDPKMCGDDKRSCDHSFCVLSQRTFIKPGVDQVYTFVTSVPEPASYIRVFASFKYPEHYSILQKCSLAISRRLGLINYTLKNINKPHTVERIFKV
jgi:hypothetical protein